ncbi:hypothetical protein TNCV_2189851 [Trichonephila clavipes]|nr:hypothetical protein TNCV_2189851 [Trichonephila clavipes]
MRITAGWTGFGWCEGGKRILAYLSGKLRSRIFVDQTSLMVKESESFGVKGGLGLGWKIVNHKGMSFNSAYEIHFQLHLQIEIDDPARDMPPQEIF